MLKKAAAKIASVILLTSVGAAAIFFHMRAWEVPQQSMVNPNLPADPALQKVTSTTSFQKSDLTIKVKNQLSGPGVYKDPQFGFGIRYPNGYGIDIAQRSEPGFPGFPTELRTGTQVVAINALVDSGGLAASLLIFVSDDPRDIQNCLMIPPGTESDVMNASHKSINGADYAYYETWSAGTGQFAADHIYKTFRKNACYAIDDEVNGPDQPRDAITISDAFAQLDAIARTFIFAS
jgi:hypothetical protein